MRQSLARYSATVSFVHAPSLADFITTIVGFEVFGMHNDQRWAVVTSPALANYPPMRFMGGAFRLPSLAALHSPKEKSPKLWPNRYSASPGCGDSLPPLATSKGGCFAWCPIST